MANVVGAQQQNPRAWSFLVIEEDRKTFRGNTGYDDLIGSHYSFDSRVPHHADVKTGDLALIRDSDYAYGVGWIRVVDRHPGLKQVNHCTNPACQKTDLSYRTTMFPPYRCGACGKTFEIPDIEMVPVAQYRADYRDTWQLFDPFVPLAVFEPTYLQKAVQNSIRPLDLLALRSILDGYGATGSGWWDIHFLDDSFIPGGQKEGKTKTRVGQERFRQEMLDRFGESCAICGPQPRPALDAAHLYSYAKDPKHDPRGGLLLRRDLHSLFDSGLLSIDPTSWTIEISPSLAAWPQLTALHGQPLKVLPELRPNPQYLQDHRELWHVI